MYKLRANISRVSVGLLALLLTSACGKKDNNKKDEAPQEDSGEAVPAGCSDVGSTKPAASPIFVLADAARAKCHAFYVSVEWLAGPKTGEGNSEARLVFADAQGNTPEAVTGVTFKPWMTVHDHGAPMRKQTIAVDPNAANTFIVSGINFIMGGPWDLFVSATVNGHADEATASVQVP